MITCNLNRYRRSLLLGAAGIAVGGILQVSAPDFGRDADQARVQPVTLNDDLFHSKPARLQPGARPVHADQTPVTPALDEPTPMFNPRASTAPDRVHKRYVVSARDRAEPRATLATVEDFVTAAGGRVVQRTSNLIAVELSAADFADLETRFSVQSFEDKLVRASSITALQTANPSAASANAFATSGSTVGIAVLDSGVAAHADTNLVQQIDIVPPTRAEAYGDDFDASQWNGSDDVTAWSTLWIEYQDDGSSHSGVLQQTTVDGESVLRIHGNGTFVANDRIVDVYGADSMSISFDWKRGDSSLSARFWVEAYSHDTGWVQVQSFARSDTDDWQSVTVDLNGYISHDTKVSFSTSEQAGYETLIDNVRVQYTLPDTSAQDGLGHGTHIAGIASGNGSQSGGAHTGVAPGARIHSVRVLNSHGLGYVSDVIAGLDWVQQHATQYHIRVANLSLGKGVESAAGDDPPRAGNRSTLGLGCRGRRVRRKLWRTRSLHDHQSG